MTRNPNPWKYIFAICIIIAAAFFPCLKAGFVNWDDTAHVFENAQVRIHSFDNLIDIFKRTVNRTYIPLTILSFNLENAVGGLNPFLYHADNVILHVSVAVLVFILGMKFGLPQRAAFFAALIYGLHPMRVESVAWVTQRKDMLYSLFYLLAVHSYWIYVTRGKKKHYVYTIIFGVLSILSKPMALSLPWILWFIDGLAGRKFSKLSTWLDKIPLFLAMQPIAWITYSLNARTLELAWPQSALIWLWTNTFYLKKFIVPQPLSVIYPLPQPVDLSSPAYGTALGIFTVFCFCMVRFRRNRLFLFACLFYCGSTFFLWRYDDAVDITMVADRFMYLPSFGFCLLLGFWGHQILEKTKEAGNWQWRGTLIFGSLLVGFLFIKTWSQSLLWTDGSRLWKSALDSAPENTFLLLTMGNSLAKEGQYEEALIYYDKAAALDPNYADAYDKRGVIYDEIQNRPDLAVNEFDRAIRSDPRHAMAFYHKGNTLLRAQQYDPAMDNYNKALEINPQLAEAYINRAQIFMSVHQNYDAALLDLNQGIAADPGFAEGYINRGIILSSIRGEHKQAIEDFTRAIKLDPSSISAYLNRAKVYQTIEQIEAATPTPGLVTPGVGVR